MRTMTGMWVPKDLRGPKSTEEWKDPSILFLFLFRAKSG